MSASISNLMIDPATARAALAELGLTEAEFWALDADGLEAVIDAHGQRFEQWKAREDARIAAAQSRRDQLQGVPKDMSIWHAGQEGFIDQGAARDALYAVFQLQQAEQTDPQPNTEAVAALLSALAAHITASAEA